MKLLFRRDFLKSILKGAVWLPVSLSTVRSMPHGYRLHRNPSSTIYRAINGSPEKNTSKVVEMMGGIGKFIESDAVVLIKPNVQWWNQGAANLAATKTLVDLIMNRPGGFLGEVVVAENCHRGLIPWKSRHSGWVPSFERNSDVPDVSNMNELCSLMKRKYASRFSTVHWVDVADKGKRVFSPKDGEGYVYWDGTGGLPLITCENGAAGREFRSTIMTYPIFRTDRGTMVDFKNGVWEKGAYTGQPLRFINLAALNHHSTFCGVTSAVKNYMGITDLSGGSDPTAGRLSESYYNFHSFAFNGSTGGPVPGMLGKEIGVFIKTVRKADLNITTAEWVGLASRTDLPAARTRTVLASPDPVALDYHGAKYLLYPNSKLAIHDPDRKRSPVREYLDQCAAEKGGVMDEGKVLVKSYDFKRPDLQPNGDWMVRSEIEWGSNPKALIKYGVLRMGIR